MYIYEFNNICYNYSKTDEIISYIMYTTTIINSYIINAYDTNNKLDTYNIYDTYNSYELPISIISYKNNKTEFNYQNSSINNASSCISKTRFLIKLVNNFIDSNKNNIKNNERVNQKNDIVLKGIIKIHTESCLKEDCPLTKFMKYKGNYIIQNLINSFNKEEKEYSKYKRIIQNNSITLVSNNKQNESEITVDLRQCEYILKDIYNISSNDSLYLLILIFNEAGMKIPKVEYEVYYPLYNISSLIKLNLSYCKNRKVDISIPVTINESLDKYNPKSDYYNSICSKATSDYGTDITLEDRKNEYIDNNMTLCEENCELIDYNYITEKVKCS